MGWGGPWRAEKPRSPAGYSADKLRRVKKLFPYLLHGRRVLERANVSRVPAEVHRSDHAAHNLGVSSPGQVLYENDLFGCQRFPQLVGQLRLQTLLLLFADLDVQQGQEQQSRTNEILLVDAPLEPGDPLRQRPAP